MKILALIITLSVSSLFSCKTSAPAMGSDSIVPANSGKSKQTDNEVVYDMIVSFISKGEGIDNAVRDKVDQAIEKFNTKNKTSIQPEKVGWGREGEVDYLFKAKNLSTAQQKDFSAKIKAAVGNSDIVFISYNKKAVHKR